MVHREWPRMPGGLGSEVIGHLSKREVLVVHRVVTSLQRFVG